jgi:teichuronic acid exporter
LTTGQWVPLLLGDKWSEAIPMIVILCLVWAISFTRVFVSPYLRALGYPRALLLPAVCASACTIAAVFLTAHQSAIYIIAAWSCRVAVTYPLGLYLLRKYAHVNFRRQLQPLLTPFFCVFVMATCVEAAQMIVARSGWSNLAVLMLSVTVGVISYTAMVLLIYRKTWPAMLANRRGNALKSAR